jgi:hypothetical protein
MKQLLTIVHHELLDYWRDGRFRALSLTMLMLLLAVGAWGWHSYRTSESERLAFQGQVWEQWINQGAKHPHRAAHFGQYVIKPELPLAGFDPGVKPTVGQTLWVEAHTRSAYSYAPMDDSPAMQTRFGITGVAGVVQITDHPFGAGEGGSHIARERESGTLRQMLALGIPPARWLRQICGGLYRAVAGASARGAADNSRARVSHTDAATADHGANHADDGSVPAVPVYCHGHRVCHLRRVRHYQTAKISMLILWYVVAYACPRLSGHLAAYISRCPNTRFSATASITTSWKGTMRSRMG